MVIGESIAVGLARFSNFCYTFFRNALNFGIGEDRTEQVFWRIDNLSFPAFIKNLII